MTLTLDFSPTEERLLTADAQREGLSVEEYIRRRVLPESLLSAPAAVPEWKAKLQAGQQIMRRAFAASGMTDEQLAQETEAEVKAYRAERQAAAKRPVEFLREIERRREQQSQ